MYAQLQKAAPRVLVPHQLAGAAPGRHLQPLCSDSITKLILKILKISREYQPGQLWPAGTLFASPQIERVYNPVTDDDDETLLLVGPLTLHEAVVPNNANEPTLCSLVAAPPLPEYMVEVALC